MLDSRMKDAWARLAENGPAKMIGRQLGMDPLSARRAIEAAIPILAAAMERKASSREGARTLYHLCEKEFAAGLLDDLPSFVGRSADTPANGVVRSLLGTEQSATRDALAGATGLDTDSAQRLLTMIVPLAMAALGAVQHEARLDPIGLAALLQQRTAALESVTG